VAPANTGTSDDDSWEDYDEKASHPSEVEVEISKTGFKRFKRRRPRRRHCDFISTLSRKGITLPPPVLNWIRREDTVKQVLGLENLTPYVGRRPLDYRAAKAYATGTIAIWYDRSDNYDYFFKKYRYMFVTPNGIWKPNWYLLRRRKPSPSFCFALLQYVNRNPGYRVGLDNRNPYDACTHPVELERLIRYSKYFDHILFKKVQREVFLDDQGRCKLSKSLKHSKTQKGYARNAMPDTGLAYVADLPNQKYSDYLRSLSERALQTAISDFAGRKNLAIIYNKCMKARRDGRSKRPVARKDTINVPRRQF